MCTWAEGLSSSDILVRPATALAVTYTSWELLLGESNSTDVIVLSICSLSCRRGNRLHLNVYCKYTYTKIYTAQLKLLSQNLTIAKRESE
jgi:hypothetical protein